ncbi:uncharacterized protein BDZ99DRAFT_525501 [Mytilinidion resinicola]|uniref:Uncharacterized protein n=1 Tax=Mytilinidion resinicola TaxID=574789 RepID=A0A6A6Y760_9PEZI|nr:uncharacterized protein BDZ99DRAFT_525501 [Mytilinidion resinicola]KAF2804671.1 hypothetical protein BDZ99DRAFT_525501 [Mytilinidion resinicola]
MEMVSSTSIFRLRHPTSDLDRLLYNGQHSSTLLFIVPIPYATFSALENMAWRSFPTLKKLRSIVFVHGLTGSRRSTWTYHPGVPDEECFWPRDILPHSQDVQRINHISASTCGILFMGTPHQGAPSADMASIFGDLGRKGTHLEDIRKRFDLYLAEREQASSSIHVACCFEQNADVALRDKVVPDESAILDRYTQIAIHADHKGMTKFGHRNDNDYQRVLQELKEWVKDTTVKSGAESPKASPIHWS